MTSRKVWKPFGPVAILGCWVRTDHSLWHYEPIDMTLPLAEKRAICARASAYIKAEGFKEAYYSHSESCSPVTITP